ncbi:UNVERIFIED_CONTAM: hypothetical protein RMT77_001569 [Armadillidium vulgare]
MIILEVVALFWEYLTFFQQLNVYVILFWIYLFVFIVLFCISSFGKQLGLRDKYIQILLKVFEFGCSKVKSKRKRGVSVSEGDDDDDDEDEEDEVEPKYLSLDQKCFEMLPVPTSSDRRNYHFEDIFPYVTDGISTIIHDDVIPQFISEELPYWNLLSRNNDRAYEFVSIRLTVFWLIGFIIRYCLLLPLRLIILFVGMMLFFFCSVIIGPFPNGLFKRNMNSKIIISCFDFVAGSLSLVATFHDIENRPKCGIAVANHTSPIDSMILATDNCYDMVGQKHGGLLGFFMNVLSRNSFHIWFERSEARDRAHVTKRLKDHALNPDLPPVLIFPEGVCVNNTCVMQFKKGAFEVVDKIHPIAIKFDSRFGDAFWWQDQFFNYVLYMMTSWAIVCDVWYLPPMERREDESALNFAHRVKSAIAEKGGLMNVSWDGFLKAAPIKAEWKGKYQQAFAQQLLGVIENEKE